MWGNGGELFSGNSRSSRAAVDIVVSTVFGALRRLTGGAQDHRLHLLDEAVVCKAPTFLRVCPGSNRQDRHSSSVLRHSSATT